jgi:hypothetical protein
MFYGSENNFNTPEKYKEYNNIHTGEKISGLHLKSPNWYDNPLMNSQGYLFQTDNVFTKGVYINFRTNVTDYDSIELWVGGQIFDIIEYKWKEILHDIYDIQKKEDTPKDISPNYFIPKDYIPFYFSKIGLPGDKYRETKIIIKSRAFFQNPIIEADIYGFHPCLSNCVISFTNQINKVNIKEPVLKFNGCVFCLVVDKVIAELVLELDGYTLKLQNSKISQGKSIFHFGKGLDDPLNSINFSFVKKALIKNVLQEDTEVLCISSQVVCYVNGICGLRFGY